MKLNINKIMGKEPKWEKCRHCGKEWSEASYYIIDKRVEKCPECRCYLHTSIDSDEVKQMCVTKDYKERLKLFENSNTLKCDECKRMCNELFVWNAEQKKNTLIKDKHGNENWKDTTGVSQVCPVCHYSHSNIEIGRKMKDKDSNKPKSRRVTSQIDYKQQQYGE